MSSTGQANTPENRQKARARVRHLTRGAILAATGATAVIGIVVAHAPPRRQQHVAVRYYVGIDLHGLGWDLELQWQQLRDEQHRLDRQHG